MLSTLVVMSTISLGCLALEKLLYELGYPTHAQYLNITASSTLAVTALTAALKLIRFIAAM